MQRKNKDITSRGNRKKKSLLSSTNLQNKQKLKPALELFCEHQEMHEEE